MDVNTKIASPVAGSVADGRNHRRDVNRKFHQGILRKREPTGAYKNEHPTRYNIQKTKDFVKRQKPKGQYYGGAETNSQVVEERFPEYGSVLVPIPRSKRENGNHLLNFRYDRNMTRDVQSRDVGRYGCNNNRSLPPIQRHKYNKDLFVLTSCQFVVMQNGDYSSHLTNPDILVDWKLVEQVKFYNSGSLSVCPICLEIPYASKMTRCGHVYCWPCILRHLHVHEEMDHIYECPICHEYICKSDLKSAVEITRSAIKLGDTINLRLMRREKNSLFATSVESAIQPPTNFLTVSENNVSGIYSKLLIASVQDIVHIIECERSELQLGLTNNPEMIPYIHQALAELSKREKKLLLKATESKDASSTENIAEKEGADDASLGNEVNANRDDNKPLAKQSSIDSVSSDNQSTSTSPKYSYFYQAEDGQHVYLHAANVKMLEMQYGSLEFCPPVITGRLLEKEASICTEDLRRRLRYLCHLPLTCPFELAEIELKPPLVSEDVLRVFREQLKSRQKYREQREREERKREKKIKEEENRQIGIYPIPNIEIASYQHFPQLQSELFPNELSIAEPATSSMAGSPPLSACDDIVARQEADNLSQTRSFADITKSMSTMLITRRNKSAWPAVKSKTHSNIASTSGNDDELLSTASTRANNKSVRDAWPIVKSRTYSGISGTLPGKDEESNATNVWFMKSKESTSSTSSNEDEKKPCASDQANDDGNTIGKKKKKKKGKCTVLLTTGMTSGYSI